MSLNRRSFIARLLAVPIVGPALVKTGEIAARAKANLIGYFDYGNSVALSDEEKLTVDFDPTTGVFTLADDGPGDD